MGSQIRVVYMRIREGRMNISELLAETGGLRSIARELGIKEDEAASGAEALLPAIMGGFEKRVQSEPDGLAGLAGLLGQLGGGSLLDNVLADEPTDVSQGNQVLGQIFGSKDVSRTVARDASSRSGLSPELLKRMLPLLAMLAAGYMARRRGGESSGGGLGDLLGGLLRGRRG
jgi:hypothetical protein